MYTQCQRNQVKVKDSLTSRLVFFFFFSLLILSINLPTNLTGYAVISKTVLEPT